MFVIISCIFDVEGQYDVKTDNRQILCSTELSNDDFWGFKIVKRSVGSPELLHTCQYIKIRRFLIRFN